MSTRQNVQLFYETGLVEVRNTRLIHTRLTLIMMAGGFLNTRTLNNFQVSALILGNVSIFFSATEA